MRRRIGRTPFRECTANADTFLDRSAGVVSVSGGTTQRSHHNWKEGMPAHGSKGSLNPVAGTIVQQNYALSSASRNTNNDENA